MYPNSILCCEFAFIDKIPYIPDRATNGKIYAEQIPKLKCLIATCIDKQRLFSATIVRQLLSSAVQEFSKNALATFDFMEITTEKQIAPDTYTKYLLQFFTFIRKNPMLEKIQRIYKHTSEEILSNVTQDAFGFAAARLSERFLDTLHHFILRNNIPTVEVPDTAKNWFWNLMGKSGDGFLVQLQSTLKKLDNLFTVIVFCRTMEMCINHHKFIQNQVLWTSK